MQLSISASPGFQEIGHYRVLALLPHVPYAQRLPDVFAHLGFRETGGPQNEQLQASGDVHFKPIAFDTHLRLIQELIRHETA